MSQRMITVRVVPNASRSTIIGWEDPPDGMPGVHKILRVRLAAPPVDGKANDALLRFLAEAGGVRKQHLHLKSGTTSRVKTIEVPDDWSLPDTRDG